MKHKLTASQIRQFDEAMGDKVAAEKTIRIALNFHSNRQAEIDKSLKGLWKELGDIHEFDPERKTFYIRTIDGAVVATDEPPTEADS